ncbi:hypothetical protein HYDPIDRAFT_105943 [Hydnomerulius pinastri MD-312]|nr:hypothetical protein HYDPIDRAFT_105943 [Hydnomerulius pinastri MD-312]
MVKLSLISPKGNQGVRFFPHQGYLGLTPLKFEGLVRTQIEQDGKPILAKDIFVTLRCYESRQGRLGTVQTNVLFEHTVTLWRKQDGQEWSEVGDSEYPFRLSIPSHVAAPSTALYFQEYRIFWRIEAVLNHIPISAVGCRQVKYFDVPLVRYDTAAGLSPPTPLTPPSSSYLTSLTKSRGPPLRYRVLVPPNPIGPLDIVSVQLIVQPLDHSVSIRSASALVERRIHLNDVPSGPPTPSVSIPSQPSSQPFTYFPLSSSSTHDASSSIYQGGASSAATSMQDLHYPTSSSSLYSDSSSRPLLQNYSTDEPGPSSSNDRGTTHIFAHAESSGRFSKDSTGGWRQSLTFSWPDTKSNSRWAVGETVQTDMATVKFFLRVKLVISSPTSSAETVELEDKELIILSTNDSQRQLALSRYSELVHASSGRSKSKSPRRSKRDRHTEQLPSPPRSPRLAPVSDVHTSTPPVAKPHHHVEPSPGHVSKFSSASAPYPSSSGQKAKTSRRPHTSAGPRDKPGGFDSRGHQPLRNQSNQLSVPLRPETAYPTPLPNNSQNSRGIFRQKWVEAPRLGSSSSMSSGGHFTLAESSQHSEGSLLFEQVDQVEVQAWEAELARIECASRRSSADMMSFVSQRKKGSIERPVIRTFLHAEG